MPLSKKQLRWAPTAEGTKALGEKKVAEWDDESRGLKLPETANKTFREADFRARQKAGK